MKNTNLAVTPSRAPATATNGGNRTRPSALLLTLATLAWSGNAPAATVFDCHLDGGTVGAPIPTLADSGPNGVNGSIVGLKFAAAGPGGGTSSADARGDLDYAAVLSNAAMNVQEFTLSLKAMATGNGFGAPNPHREVSIVAKRGIFGNCSPCDSWGIEFDAGSNQFVGYIGQTFNGTVGSAVRLASTHAFLRNDWHDVALSLDRDVSGPLDLLQLFVDRALEASATGNFSPFRSATRRAVPISVTC